MLHVFLKVFDNQELDHRSSFTRSRTELVIDSKDGTSMKAPF